MEKQAFLPPLAALMGPLMMAPIYGASSAISGAISGRARGQLDKAMERLMPSEPAGMVQAKKYGGLGGLGVGALGGTMLGTAVGDEFGVPVPGALLGALGGAAAGNAGGKLLGESGYNLNKYMATHYPKIAPYATGAGAGAIGGGILGEALFDDSRLAGGAGGALVGGLLGAIANSALARKGKFGGLLGNVAKKKLHKKSSAWVPGMVSGGLGAAGLAGGFGFGNFDLTTKQVLLQRMLPALLAGGAGGALLGSFFKGNNHNVAVQE